MLTPPFESDLFYAVQNEDVHSELALLRELDRPRQRVLMIASAGENALGLLCQPEVVSIDAVDLSLAQIQLCTLRCAAAEQLSRDEQLTLFGCEPALAGPGGAPARLALYDRLRPALQAETLAFWDARREAEIAFGVHHVGRNDRLMQDLVAALAQAGIRPLYDHPATIDATTWLAVYQQTLTPEHLQHRFGFPNPEIAARLAALTPHLAAQHLRALQQPDAAHNPYVTTVFLSSYASAGGETGLPLYLQQAGQEALRELGIAHRLSLHHGNLLERMPHLAAQGGGYDLISLSNIADWMQGPQIEALVGTACACLNPGGALLLRAANPEAPIDAVVSAMMDSDPGRVARLQAGERGPWFRSIAAGFRRA
jgi:S-adenosylmethionine:diacylglycerol 3-amino-3-carboxypropyl transferase